MATDNAFDVVVIGEGMAGLSAAHHAASLGLKVASVECNLFGGLVINIAELESYPAAAAISGVDVASALMQHNADLGVESVPGNAQSIAADGPVLRVATDQRQLGARNVIIATGARLKKLGVPGEAEFEYRGVSQCADCDAPLFKDADVIVAGGGDAALQEALTLARYCRKVSIALRGERFRARRAFVDRIRGLANVEVLPRTAIEAIVGDQTVETVRLRDVAAGATREVAASGVFAFVGLEPNGAFAPAAIARDAGGRLVTDAALETALPGVFAAGAVRSGCGGLMVNAMSDGAAAAQAAFRRLHTG